MVGESRTYSRRQNKVPVALALNYSPTLKALPFEYRGRNVLNTLFLRCIIKRFVIACQGMVDGSLGPLHASSVLSLVCLSIPVSRSVENKVQSKVKLGGSSPP